VRGNEKRNRLPNGLMAKDDRYFFCFLVHEKKKSYRFDGQQPFLELRCCSIPVYGMACPLHHTRKIAEYFFFKERGWPQRDPRKGRFEVMIVYFSMLFHRMPIGSNLKAWILEGFSFFSSSSSSSSSSQFWHLDDNGACCEVKCRREHSRHVEKIIYM